MELFRSLRISAGYNVLKKRAIKVRRNRDFVNLSTAQTIGIVWDITNEDDLPPISDFILQMNERGIKVEVIAIFQGKLLPDKLTALRYITCLKREDLSYFYLPKTPESEKFIKAPFDLLIEITSRNFLPIRYITSLNPARCKVSSISGNTADRDYADIIIDGGKGIETKEYLKQVVAYLELINRK